MAERKAPPPAPVGVVIGTSMMALLALVMLTFVLEVSGLGAVRHARAQSLAYDQLRSELALATAPTGQLDQDGQPLTPGSPIGLLEIPSIGVREVVFEGTSSGILQSGPGHRRDTVFPGQAGTSVIMGRQATYGGPFRRIASLTPGTPITVTTGQGVSHYKVTGVRHAGDLYSAAEPQAGRLTLVTGSGPLFMPSGTVRVDARLFSNTVPAPGFAFGSQSLSPSEQAMARDTGGVLRLFLWAQLLFVLSIAMVWLRSQWGKAQTWMVAVPVIGFTGLQVAHYAAQLLPNLM